MSLKTLMAADAAIFTNTGELGESVTYTPPGNNPTPRTVAALVVRHPPKRYRNGLLYVPSVEVWLKNSASVGISSTESFIGGTLTVALHEGRSATELTIPAPNPIEQDGGLICISF